jgi:leader peptidase (prepilin peptidase)/N-methyltransferase
MAAALTIVLVVVTVADLRTRTIPDRALLPAAAFAIATLTIADPSSVPERLTAGAAAGGFLLAAALIRPDGMGQGDVKLAAVLGLYLGLPVAVALLFALLAGSLAGLALLVRHGPAAPRMTIPFAPYLAGGALVAAFAVP